MPTTTRGLVYPLSTDPPNGPGQMQALANSIESMLNAGLSIPNLALTGSSGKSALAIGDTGSQSSGLTIGGDTNLYRLSAGQLKTDQSLQVGATLRHLGSSLGFFGVAAASRPGSTAEIKGALAGLGLLTDGGASPLDLDGGAFTAGSVTTVTLSSSFLTLLSGTQITSASVAASGAGLELKWDGSKGIVEAYNRGTGVRQPLSLYGNGVSITADPTGALTSGNPQGIFVDSNSKVHMRFASFAALGDGAGWVLASGTRHTITTSDTTSQLAQSLSTLISDMASSGLI